jgi:predicted DNA-binding transcriptional regulator AlpA
VKRHYESPDPLLAPAAAADETGRALSTFWRDVKSGLLPTPRYVGIRRPRWRRSELRAAIDAIPRKV